MERDGREINEGEKLNAKEEKRTGDVKGQDRVRRRTKINEYS